ncbi:ABC transporter ATP-binding protein [Alteribacter natronophilus]|uniref:ABC transporter ATP-binding protein n=1 Tax=Alteribacter natronophilus TaxID=2583810 RepID=UPI001485F7FC|nr:ABC transporter ATP-binding protein [Alteribacter natronophilus]
MSFLEIDRLSKTFGQKPVFTDISINSAEGDILSLAGPSGTGKSTFLRCLAGLEKPSSGRVLIDGEDMSGLRAEKRPVVLMFQQPMLFPHMTVLENVTYGLKIRKVRRKERTARGLDMLEKVSLKTYADKYPSQCSGGQQQRIALARALIIKPRLLLLDEPFSSLDEQLRHSLRVWVRNLLKEENMTSVFVTHDREEAVFMGDRLAVMDEGGIAQIGTAEEVTGSPVSSRVSLLVGDGLNLGNGFVPAEAVTLETCVTENSETDSIEAVVERVWKKHGVTFVNVRTGKGNFTIHSSRTVSEGDSVQLVWKRSTFRTFKQVKDDRHA